MQKKRDIAAAERWRGRFNPNRTYSRSVGSPGPDSSLVQPKRDFAATEEQQQGSSNSKSGMSPVGWKPGARHQFSAGKTRICSSRTVAGQFQLKSDMQPFGWKSRAKQQFSAGSATLRSSRTVAGQYQIRSGMHPCSQKPRARQQFSAGQAILRSSRIIEAKRQPLNRTARDWGVSTRAFKWRVARWRVVRSTKSRKNSTLA